MYVCFWIDHLSSLFLLLQWLQECSLHLQWKDRKTPHPPHEHEQDSSPPASYLHLISEHSQSQLVATSMFKLCRKKDWITKLLQWQSHLVKGELLDTFYSTLKIISTSFCWTKDRNQLKINKNKIWSTGLINSNPVKVNMRIKL